MSELATLGGGCYWCLDAFYRRIRGIKDVTSGYAGGTVPHPTIQEVYGGKTGHAEVVQITFDSSIITYREILEIFFVMHDPTTLNRQGNDVGEEYRSIIFYHTDQQKLIAEDMLRHFAPTLYSNPIVTQLEPYTQFWPADEDSQDFYSKNPTAGYCMIVIDPKIQKLRQKFATHFKSDTA